MRLPDHCERGRGVRHELRAHDLRGRGRRDHGPCDLEEFGQKRS